MEHNLLNIRDNAKIPREMERAWLFLPETLRCKFVLTILRILYQFASAHFFHIKMVNKAKDIIFLLRFSFLNK